LSSGSWSITPASNGIKALGPVWVGARRRETAQLYRAARVAGELTTAVLEPPSET